MANLKRHSPRRGLSTVELAIILPVMLWLTFGVIEFGWMFLKMQEITNATRQGARVAARADATIEQIEAAVDGALTAAGFTPSQWRIDYALGNPANTPAGEIFSLSVQADYVDIELGMPLVPKPPVISSTMTMVKEGT